MTPQERKETIERMERDLAALKAEDAKSQFKWDYNGSTYYIGSTDIYPQYNISSKDIMYGSYRKTKETAEQSLLRNKRANRLEALVEQIQGDLSGDYFIYYNISRDTWYKNTATTVVYPEIVLMQESTAVTICNMLNEGTFSLTEEL